MNESREVSKDTGVAVTYQLRESTSHCLSLFNEYYKCPLLDFMIISNIIYVYIHREYVYKYICLYTHYNIYTQWSTALGP